ncbi:hypothetical protein [Altererythrobacter sp. BO-6]|uniref:hypothetical protein n=1 Tax=Altererythrobacter sp. BO-6 TaxID=2604537 RepID=UPI001F49806E|nr:hypothetical protein [Altererythrobacter sp. BO-6]
MIRQFCAATLLVTLAACGGNSGEGDEAAKAVDVENAATGPEESTTMANGEPAYGFGDAKDPETGYHATTILKCGFDNASPTQSCEAGVKRNWNGEGEHLVEVTKPDGRKRAIFFKGTEAYGADSAQADGSAGWDFKTTRDGDQLTISFGPETYVIVDAFIEGG